MATIKDVASKAGVSITTVSRVMNDRGPLSEATKKAVHDAMEELGYFPNDVARALGKNSLNIMGLIVPTIKHPFFGELVHACEDETYRRGYKLMVVASDYNEKKRKTLRGYFKKKYGGWDLLCVTFSEQRIFGGASGSGSDDE